MRAPPKSERMGTEGSHPSKKHEDLVANLASACPAWVAYADEGAPSGERKWFAAATRVRGQALKDMSDTSQVLLFQPRILPYPSKADAYMPNLHVKICFPLPPPAEAVQTLVIVSDSTLDLPGVIYGLQREASLIKERPLRLLWIAVRPGAGAKELAKAWSQAPKCHYGLTVVNLNDCLRDKMYDFTDHIEEDLRALVVKARTHCDVRSDLFINHAEFYPALDPAYAQRLVPRYTKTATDAGARVHNGESWLGQIKLRDTMHFAAESTREVVDMYISAVRLMVKDVPPPPPPPPPPQQKTDESESMCAGSDYSADPEEEAESEDPEKGPEEDPEEDQGPESAEAVRQQLLEMFQQWNENNEVQKPVPQCLLQQDQVLLPTHMPARLSPPDDRFHNSKKSESSSAMNVDRRSVFRLYIGTWAMGVRIASSRAPSIATNGTISLPS